MILKMRGTPREPVPGRADNRILVTIDEQGSNVDYEDAMESKRDDIKDEACSYIQVLETNYTDKITQLRFALEK